MGTILLLLAIGVFAGFLNTIAGGGSLLTLPILIFLGLPTAVANGTNRVALVVQNGVAVWNFRRKGFFDWRLGLFFGIPAMIGSILGARLAIYTPDAVFNKILAFVMLVVLWLTIRPKKKKSNFVHQEHLSKKQRIIGVLGFILIGVYSGFIQAGVGFVIMAFTSTLIGMSLVKVNSIKGLVIGLCMITSLITYILHGDVRWSYGLLLAAGQGAGAWVGSNFAVNKGDKWIQRILVVTVLFMAAKLFFKF
ncbi:sulfite exporter TauE/SafE family protein [Desulfitobacterium sp.]|uniref:sulfite exporter TauE/SafE family protein n=1 Tax=Desulfitobacterium sp. TaxID=49981 RepID=UPI002CED57E4|nr:sulfite exporter TauE/SafE family protein [Desulfitobacterium sp.]HVJ49035.1 sulfite exporter TauE/SafE family protein [Desulfitobacterium sp.]